MDVSFEASTGSGSLTSLAFETCLAAMGYAVAEDFNMGVASQRTNQAGVQQHVPEPSRALPLALQSLPVPHGTPCTELPLAVDDLMHDGLNFSSTRQTPLVSWHSNLTSGARAQSRAR